MSLETDPYLITECIHKPLLQEIAGRVGFNAFLIANRFREERPECFEKYASLGLELRHKDDIAGDWFLRNAPAVIKNKPEFLEEYARIGLKLQKEDDDYDTGTPFWVGAARVLTDKPDLLEEYVRLGLDVWEKDKVAGSWFFQKAPDIIQKAPNYLNVYVTLGLAVTQKDSIFGAWFFAHAPDFIQKNPDDLEKYARYGLELLEQGPNTDLAGSFFKNAPEVIKNRPCVFEQYIEAGKRVLRKDRYQTIDFYKRTPDLLRKLDPNTLYIPEQLLLESIHDLKSAQVIGQVIDMEKYGKQFAEKCGRFY